MEPRGRGLAQAMGLVVLGVAIALALIVSASIVTNGIKDIKRSRDTVVVTGSARYPIEANLATWSLRATAQERTPQEAIAALRAKVNRIDSFLARGGLAGASVSKPPIQVQKVFVQVPTGLKKPRFRTVPAWNVSQGFAIQTKQIDRLERLAAAVGNLLAAGTDVSVSRIQYLSTELTEAKFAALERAVADARRRGETIAKGLDGRLGAVTQTNLGVYQITPRDSTEVSDYGINDVSSRLKDVQAVVAVTFRLER